MALDEKIFKHLQENLSRSSGGGIHLKSANAKLIDAPILVIGLGGTGADALIQIKHLVNERLNTDSDKDKPDNIEYLVIDTDSIKKRHLDFNGTKLSDVNSEFCLIEDAKLQKIYQNLDSNQMPYISDWISDKIDMGLISDGAGGIRQVGRFLFIKEFSSNIRLQLERKIKNITTKKNTKQRVYVFIVAGISGGTGSGTFIDMPYIVRKLLEDLDYHSQIAGFIFMPDVNLLDIKQEDESTKMSIQRNGFAALKELDYLMNLGKNGNGERFEQDYGANFKVSFDRAPYDICHLVSSINAKGETYSKEHCMAVTAETILNFIADEPNIGDQSYMIAEYISNIKNNTAIFVSSLGKKLPIGYRYLTIGSSTAVLPMDDVLNYLTYILFKNMNEIYENTPSPSEVDEAAMQLSINPDNIDRMVRLDVSMTDVDLYTYDVIKNNPDIVSKALDKFIQKSLPDILERNVNNFLTKFRENSKKYLEGIFIDTKKGPAYTSKLINCTENHCLLEYINELLNGILIKNKISDIDISRLEQEMNMAHRKLIDSRPILTFNKQGTAETYKKACKNYYSALLVNMKQNYIINCYKEIYNILNDINDKVFTIFTEIITVLKVIFEEYADIANDTNIKKEGTTTVFSWDIIDPNVLVTEIELLINNNEDFKINFKNTVSDFIKNLINKSSEWLNDTKPNLSAKLNEFILKEFSMVASQSIDFYIKMITEDDDEKKESFISEKIKMLSDTADVMFPANIFGTSLQQPTYKYISVPYNASSFDEKLNNVGIMKKSVITNRISMLNVTIANPLMAYREIEKYESVYEYFQGIDSVGMHLYETQNKNWHTLPSPIYESARIDKSGTSRQAKENKRLRELFDKAVEYGYIVWDEENKQFACLYSSKPYDVFEALKEMGIDNLEDNIPRPDAQKAINTLKKDLKDNIPLDNKKYLYDIFYDKKDNQLDLDYSKGIFINMPALCKSIDDMVKNHEEILNVINILESKVSDFVDYDYFASCIYTGLIKKERAKYVYEDSKQLKQCLLMITSDNCPDIYHEYYAFNAFTNLDNAEKQFLNKRAHKILEEADDEQMDSFVAKMQELFDYYSETRDELSVKHNELQEGIDKVHFYSEIRNQLQKFYTIYNS